MDIKITITNRNLQLKDIPVGSTFIFTVDDAKIPHMKTNETKNGYIVIMNLKNGNLCTGAWDESKVIPFDIPEIEVKI